GAWGGNRLYRLWWRVDAKDCRHLPRPRAAPPPVRRHTLAHLRQAGGQLWARASFPSSSQGRFSTPRYPVASKRAARHAGNLRLIAGNLALDFANTADWHDTGTPREFLVDYDALLDWSVHAGLADRAHAVQIAAAAAKVPNQARAALRLGLDLREAIFRIFPSIADGGATPPDGPPPPNPVRAPPP